MKRLVSQRIAEILLITTGLELVGVARDHPRRSSSPIASRLGSTAAVFVTPVPPIPRGIQPGAREGLV